MLIIRKTIHDKLVQTRKKALVDLEFIIYGFVYNDAWETL